MFGIQVRPFVSGLLGEVTDIPDVSRGMYSSFINTPPPLREHVHQYSGSAFPLIADQRAKYGHTISDVLRSAPARWGLF